MLRFKPDDWLEGLLRPFILLDPGGFIYYELPAPDLRFAAIAVLTGIVLISGRMRARLGATASGHLLSLWLIFYLWTFLVGNGRYFIAGLLLAGPLLVRLVGGMTLTRPMRVLILSGLLGLQGMLVHQHFNHGMWTMVYWRDGQGLPLGPSPLRNDPAVFVTISSISHSLLVPQFHPLSRWTNLAGQADIAPGMPEYTPLRELLNSPLPRFLVLHNISGMTDTGAQPHGEVLEMMGRTLARHGLQRDERPCEILVSRLLLQNPAIGTPPYSPLAYWFCPLRDGTPDEPAQSAISHAWTEVFESVEQRCPRFFPPGGGSLRIAGDVVFRSYNATDTRLYVEATGRVLYRHQRALNPTLIGTADEVRRGEFTLDCQKLPGRYVYPWDRD